MVSQSRNGVEATGLEAIHAYFAAKEDTDTKRPPEDNLCAK